MFHNNLNYPYSSKRTAVFSQKGMVATSQPQAAQAGRDILQQGGNAVDAAIATAACLTVVEPTSNGIGADAFAIVWIKDKLFGINGSGPAPEAISSPKIKQKGYENMPKYGWIPVTVPGAPATWAELSSRWGKLDFSEVLKPAVEIAENGFPVSPVTQEMWQQAYNTYQKQLNDSEFENWFKTFAPEGRAPRPGEIWKSADHAQTLKTIAETEADAFYKGKLADKIAAFSSKYGGFLKKKDLANFSPEWVEPKNIDYRGYKIWELPPNGQGLIALMALNILKEFEFEHKESVDTYHKQLEALKLAFSDGKKYITDPDFMNINIEDLLTSDYAQRRRRLIGKNALQPQPGRINKSGTVYLAAADSEGNMVSFIQSNYMGFGSGLVVPETGIALQNRGHTFSLNPEHANFIKPGKRTYHTIIPGFITKNKKAVGPFGVMGGYMQPQGHLQVLMNLIDFDLNPQAALDAPRWQWIEDKKVKIENNFPLEMAKLLKEKGHEIEIALKSTSFGRGQIILKDEEKEVYMGGTEPRTDGTIACL